MTVSSSSATKNKSESDREMKRIKNPGVRVVGGGVYDSQNGKTCHQCRQKTMDFSALCKNLKQEKHCTIKFCHKCLLNRYGEKAEEVALLDDWKCPKCRGICNCSRCMKKRGHKPAGALVQTAKKIGFSCVLEMLQVKGPENICHHKIVKDMAATPKRLVASKMESIAASPRKPGKENSLDENCDSSLNLRNVKPISNEKKSKKTKREGLKEICNGNMDDAAALKKSSPKKPKVSEKISRDELNRKEKSGSDFAENKTDSLGHVKKDEIDGVKIENVGVSSGVHNDDGGAKLEAAIESHKVKKSTTEIQNKEFNPDIQLPQGTSSVTVAGMELLPEDVGNALQFLEFCAAVREFAAMAVSSSSDSKNKAESDREMKRTKNPGVRVMGGRVYDSQNGKTCHQCRQKTMDFSASCKNLKQEKQCTIKFCHKCLLNRYGEKAKEVALLDDWKCPKCRGICNCSFCMKKRGHKPTGALVQTAKATGFSCVSEMLQVKGPENICHYKIVKDMSASPKKLVSSKKESMATSPRKSGKENSLDENCDSSLNLLNLTPISNGNKSKKTKRGGLKEIRDGSRDDNAALKKSTRKKHKVSEETSREELNRKEKDRGDFAEKKTDSANHAKKEEIDGAKTENGDVANDVKISGEMSKKEKPNGSKEVPKKNLKTNRKDVDYFVEEKNSETCVLKNNSLNSVKTDENDDAKIENAGVSRGDINDNAREKLKTAIESHKVKKSTTEVQNKELNSDIQLSQGTSSVTVAGIESPPEDVGNALQFLEFCAAFGEALQLHTQTGGRELQLDSIFALTGSMHPSFWQ